MVTTTKANCHSVILPACSQEEGVVIGHYQTQLLPITSERRSHGDSCGFLTCSEAQHSPFPYIINRVFLQRFNNRKVGNWNDQHLQRLLILFWCQVYSKQIKKKCYNLSHEVEINPLFADQFSKKGLYSIAHICCWSTNVQIHFFHKFFGQWWSSKTAFGLCWHSHSILSKIMDWVVHLVCRFQLGLALLI